MIQIGNVLVSEDIIEEQFACNLAACKGACCVEGDAGAPLEKDEIKKLKKDIPLIKPFLSEKGKKTIEEQGVAVRDADGDMVTPLNNGKECAFTVFDENGVATCGIEKAYEAGATRFRKPISCQLYPIRISTLANHEALNYHRWDICSPACALGEQLQVPVYKFLKDALIWRYGETWYQNLDQIAQEYLKNKST
jgi:hypothetical protein